MNEEVAIAEAIGAARDRRVMDALRRAERRERIATAIMAGLYANPVTGQNKVEHLAEAACHGAEALMDELDHKHEVDKMR